jgi:hypothetical protein
MKAETMNNMLIPIAIFCFVLSIALLDMYRNDGYPQVECALDKDCTLVYNECDCVALFAANAQGMKATDERCEINRCKQAKVSAVCKDKICLRSDGIMPSELGLGLKDPEPASY